MKYDEGRFQGEVWVAKPELRAMETPLVAAVRTNDGILALLVVVCDAWCNGWRSMDLCQREIEIEFGIRFCLGVGGFGRGEKWYLGAGA